MYPPTTLALNRHADPTVIAPMALMLSSVATQRGVDSQARREVAAAFLRD
jgi:hypothetical protein